MASAIYIFGFIYFIKNNQVFIVITLITRLIQGCGAALILITGFAMIAAAYPNKTGVVTSLNQIGIRLGLTLGPLLGSFIYRLWGFVGPFFTVGTLSIPPILIKCFIDTKKIPDGKVTKNSDVNTNIKSCNRRAVFAYLGFCLSMMKLAVLETTLSDKLMIDFHFTPDIVALYLFAYTGSSTLICFFMPLVPEWVDKRFFMVPANLVCGFSSFFIGPSPTLNIANSSSTVLAGLIFGGSLGAVVPCFVVAEAITATKRFIQPDQYQIMLNKVSGYRTFFHGFGILVGPIFGGFMMYFFGFPRLMELLGLVFILVGCTDIVFIIFEHFQERRELRGKPETNIRDPQQEESTPLLEEQDNTKEDNNNS